MESLGAAGKDLAMVGAIYPGVGNVLLGDGKSGCVVLLRFMGHVVCYDKDVGGDLCKISNTYHGEESVENHR